MAEHILIKRKDNTLTLVRSKLKTLNEFSLTEHEEIINELFLDIKGNKYYTISILQQYADDNALLSSKQDIDTFNSWVEKNVS